MTFFSQAQLYPGNQSILTQMRRKAGWGSRSQGARTPVWFSFPVREGNGLMAKEALYGPALQYSCLKNPIWSLAGYSPWGRKELDMTESDRTATGR